MKHTIELDGAFVVTKGPRNGDWRAEASIDLSKVPAGLVRELLLHGLKQKVADAASGATTEAEALGAMNKAIDAVLAGEWSSRAASGGVDERTKVARIIVRDMLKMKLGATSPAWKEFAALALADQVAKLDAVYAKNAAKLSSAVDKLVEARAQERADKAALAGEFDID